MTIIEAIKTIMKSENRALTSNEIYEKIIEQNLYSFGARDPKSIVNGIIRRHSIGVDFPTANPVKHFRLYSKHGHVNTYVLKDINNNLEVDTKNTLDEYDSLPEERILLAYLEHKKLIQQALLDRILDSDPAFFEQLVIDLLLKMGYGGNNPEAGFITGSPHDGGIDGVINEDKLGLDKIYIQAKRYSKNISIGRPDLQRFVGAMENIQKGVFFTTSNFSDTAKSYADKQQQKNIILIDGNMLTELMVDYEIGVSAVQTFITYKVDSDYFSEV